MWKDLEAKLTSLHYSRVIVPLSALLDADFFNHYIKTGNYLSRTISYRGFDFPCRWSLYSHLHFIFHERSSNMISTGNIIMLSEGRPGIDDTYSIKDGTET